MPRNFYYGKEADIVTGSQMFATLISAQPTTYGLVAAQATAFSALNATLQTAYATWANRTTRTPVATDNKQLAIKNMRASAINLAKIIYSTPTVTDGQLNGLGLLPRETRTVRPVPTVAPIVTVLDVTGRLVKVRFENPLTEDRRAKPTGVVSINLFSYVGPVSPSDPRQYHYEGPSSRMTAEVLFPNTIASGSTIWLSASWVTQRGEMSVASEPISFTLQGGGIRAAA